MTPLQMKPQDNPEGRKIADHAINEIMGIVPAPRRRVWRERIVLMLTGSALYWLGWVLWHLWRAK